MSSSSSLSRFFKRLSHRGGAASRRDGAALSQSSAPPLLSSGLKGPIKPTEPPEDSLSSNISAQSIAASNPPNPSNTTDIPMALVATTPEQILRVVAQYYSRDGKYRRHVHSELQERELFRSRYSSTSGPETPYAASTFPPSPLDDPTAGMANPYLPPSPGFVARHTELSQRYQRREAAEEKNLDRHRWRDMLPYDRHAVKVNTSVLNIGGGGDGAPEYLSASWIKENVGDVWWIAAQAPKPNVLRPFYALFTALTPAHERPHTIVQLTAEIENGRRKADRYLPSRIGAEGSFRIPLPVPSVHGRPIYDEQQGGELTQVYILVMLLSQRTIDAAQVVESELDVCVLSEYVDPRTGERRNFLLSDGVHANGIGGIAGGGGNRRRVRHLYYAGWPDHGVPDDGGESIAELAKIVEGYAVERHEGSRARPPVLVHCSAGVGRTGTFIAVSAALRQCGVFANPNGRVSSRVLLPSREEEKASPLGELPSEFDNDVVIRAIDGQREYRCAMVQSSSQIDFVYDVVGKGIQAGMR
ncbi:phosphatases II [Clavulina sp. PMI_390]|nr:phosphatases II [Clavulina sp. PMI_390]